MKRITPQIKERLKKMIFWTRFSSVSGLMITIVGWLISLSPLLVLYMKANQRQVSVFSLNGMELGFGFTSAIFCTFIAIGAVYAFVILWRASVGFQQYQKTGTIRYVNDGFKDYARFWRSMGLTLITGVTGGIFLFLYYIL